MRNITTIKTLVLLAGLMLWGFFPSAALAQSFDISGTVVDETDLPLPGAMVIVKGETRGSMTDAVGRFSLPGVSAGDVLVVSFLGYQDEEVKVGSSKDILVKLSGGDLTVNYTEDHLTLTGSAVMVFEGEFEY